MKKQTIAFMMMAAAVFTLSNAALSQTPTAGASKILGPGGIPKHTRKAPTPNGVAKPVSVQATDVGVRLTPETTNAYRFMTDWSQDGKYITYGQDADIYIVPAIGGDPINVTNVTSGECFAPSFSPDSGSIIFTWWDGVNNTSYEVDAINISTRKVTVLYDLAALGVMSRDGKYLVFRSLAGDLCVYDTTKFSLNVINSGDQAYGYIAISPDNMNIVTTMMTNNNEKRLFSIPLLGGTPVQLTFHSGEHEYPEFSPDGKWLLYTNWDTATTTSQIRALELATGAPKFIWDTAVDAYCASFAPGGKRFAYLKYNEDASAYDLYAADFPYAATLPAPKVVSPNGGESWLAGSTQMISWEGPATAKVEYSTDNGSTWTSLPNPATTLANRYEWIVPNTPSAKCLVKVSTLSGNASDTSDAVFSIVQGSTSKIHVLAPNGGETFTAGTKGKISWESSNVSAYVIELSIDGGVTWTLIPDLVIDLLAKTTEWTIPDTPSDKCLVRISDPANKAIVDVSDAKFTIVSSAASLSLAFPNGGEFFKAGSVQLIKWQASGVTKIQIDYSTDGGQTWSVVTAGADATTGMFSWTVPDASSVNCLVRITDTATTTLTSKSAGPFEISKPGIIVTAPNGGDVWTAGTSRKITWEAGGVDSFNIEYTTDGGTTWTKVASGVNAADTNVFEWTIPATISERCLIRVSDANNSGISDVSDNAFAIKNPASIKVTAPNGGEKFAPGKTVAITWTFTGLTELYLEYSADGGTNWKEIAGGVKAADGAYAWGIPDVSSTNCLVRISNSYDMSVSDVSDAVFTVASFQGGLADSAWPMFRQNLLHTGRGIGTEPAGNKVQWKFQTGEVSQTSPAIGIDGTLYIGSNDGNLYAVKSDGSLKWKYQTGSPVESSPAIGKDGTVYFGSDESGMCAVDPNGSLKWKISSSLNFTSSPAIGPDGTIYIGAIDGNLYAINPDGSVKWKFVAGGGIGSSPALALDGTIYFGANDNNLYAVKADGNLKWKFPTGNKIYSSPAIATDGTIYVGSTDKNLYAVNPDGSLKWKYLTGSEITGSSPAIGKNGVVYVGSTDGLMYSINPDGSLQWKYQTGAGIHPSPAVGSDGTIYFGSSDKNVYAVKSDGSLKWKYLTGSEVLSSPSIGSDGALYIGSRDGYMYAFSPETSGVASITVTSPNGGEIWVAGTTKNITWTSTAVVNVKIDYSTNNGSSWVNIVTSMSATTGTYAWAIPAAINSTNCRIRVTATVNSAVTDASDAIFSILPASAMPKITVSYPNGGEKITVGQNITITWTATSVTAFTVEFSLDDGTTWTSIPAAQVDNTAKTCAWTTPTTVSDKYLVRVSDANDATIIDKSDAVFSVVSAEVTAKITVTVPNGGERWTSGSSQRIQWNSFGCKNVKVEYTLNGSVWFEIESEGVGDGLWWYDWTLPADVSSNTCRIRVTETSNSALTDISDADFIISPPSKLVMVKIPAGSFQMGGVGVEYTAPSAEPVHKVTLSAFEMGKTEITQAQFMKIMDFNPSQFKGDDDRPVENMSWYEAVTFCNKLSEANSLEPCYNLTTWVCDYSKNGYRLPTEAEWEYACRAGTTTLYNSGDTEADLAKVAWYKNNSDMISHPVGRKTANAWGLFDIHGNVWELCNDLAANYSSGDQINPVGPESANLQKRIHRGGAWDSLVDAGSRVRHDVSPDARSSLLGFRLARGSFIPGGVSIAVIVPNGGEIWQSGSSQTIKWTSTNVSYVNVEFSPNGGQTWTMVAENVNSATGSGNYPFTAPAFVSANCLVRVTDTKNANVSDLSDAPFTVQPSPFIKITSPMGGETWAAGSLNQITFKAFGPKSLTFEYSTDNRVTWTKIADKVDITTLKVISAATENIPEYSLGWTLPNLAAKSDLCFVRITDTDDVSVIDRSNTAFTISPNVTLTLTRPVGGETVFAGTKSVVKWTASATVASIDISYSTDSGVSWTTAASGVKASDGSYAWTVPNLSSTTCRVKVVDSVTKAASASTRDFIIKKPSITVTSPNGGEVIESGSKFTITWKAEGIDRVSISYSTDGGNTSTNIDSDVDAAAGTYSWTVPSVSSTACAITVMSTALASLADASDAVFTIKSNAWITLIDPNGGEKFYAGQTVNIRWRSENVSEVSIAFSVDTEGKLYEIFAENLDASLGSFEWTVPDSVTTTGLIVVWDSSNTNVYDGCDAFFTTAKPSITLKYPNGGETFKTGDAVTIRWESEGLELMEIIYTTDDFSTWQYVNPSVDTARGSYEWTVPDINSSTVKIGVGTGYAADASDVVFTVSRGTKPYLHLVEPNGGGTWRAGTSQVISWDATNSTSLKIDYSTDGGSSWNLMAADVKSSNYSYSWTVPNTPSQNCTVRITDSSDATVSDASDGLFTIVESTAAFISVVTPGAGERLTVGAKREIKWNSSGVSNVKIELSIDNGTTWEAVIESSSAASGTYMWTVPDKKTTKCLIRVSDSTTPSVTGNSGMFEIMQPEIVIAHTPITQARENDKITFTAEVTGTANLVVELKYDSTGRRIFDKTKVMTKVSENTYSCFLDVGVFTAEGMEYAIVARDPDNVSLRATSPDQGYYCIRAQVSEMASPYAVTGGSLQNAYRMISMPLQLAKKSITDQLTRLPDGAMGPDWRLFRFTPGENDPKEYPNIEGFAPGIAFWLIAANNFQLKTPDGVAVTTSESFTIELKPGWNDIANPWLFDISWNDIENPSSANISKPYAYEGSWSDPTTAGSRILKPWTGYAVKNMESRNVIIRLAPKKAVSAQKEALLDGDLVWSLSLAARAGLASDTANDFGVRRNASSEWDDNDHVEPPVIGQYVTVTFPHRDWARYPSDYTVDFRPPSGDLSWDFDVRTNIAYERVAVAIDGLVTMPSGVTVAVIDRDTGRTVECAGGAFTFMSGEGLTERRFTLKTIGVEGPGRDTDERPVAFVTARAYPNPFNPRTVIRYELSEPGDVVFSVFNTVGQLVRQERLGRRERGLYEYVFDAARLTSGLYVFRVDAGFASATDKMLFMK